MEKIPEHIIQGCRQQEAKAQEQLYKLCYAEMMQVCRQFVPAIDDASVILNTAMLKVFQQIHTWEPTASFMGWVRRIVINTSVDHIRSTVKYEPHDDTTEQQYTIAPEIYSRLSGNEVLRLLHTLPKATVLVFTLYVLEGYKHQEIAKMLGISANTSKWHVSEARKLLKQKLKAAVLQRYSS